MSAETCSGLVRVRQRAVFADDEGGAASVSSGRSRRPTAAAGRLSDGVWYLCVAKKPACVVEWFTIDADDGEEEEEDGGGGAVLLATTTVTGFEAVDGESVKLPDDESFDGQPVGGDGEDGDAERRELEQRAFYLEDLESECAFLCEVESAVEREKWCCFLDAGDISDEEGEEEEEPGAEQDTADCDDGEAEEEAVNAAEQTADAQPPVITERSNRTLLRQKTSNMDGDDAFGLLSMTTSAMSALAGSVGSSAAVTSAPGVFTFDRIEIRESPIASCDDDESDRVSVSDDGCAVEGYDESSDGEDADSKALKRQVSLQIARVSSSMASQESVVAKDACFRCQKRFGRVIHRAKTCYSCDLQFCREHCSAYCHISSFPKDSKKATKQGKSVCLVCVDCMVRQELLSTISRSTTYYKEIADAGGLSKLGRWRFFDQQPKLDLAIHVQANRLGPLSLMSAMYKYRQQPFMFVVVLAQLVKNVELCIDTVDFYWPQFLQWGFVHLVDAADSVRTFYLFFLAATARRSVHLALKATWECIAAHWDAMTTGAFDRGNLIVKMLFFVTQVSFGEPRSVLHHLLFMAAPEHQRNHLERLLAEFYESTRIIYAITQPESPFLMWLIARCDEDITAGSVNVRQYLDSHDGFLDPFPEDNFEEQQLMIVERQRSGTRHVIEARQSITSTPALHIFSDAVQLVRFLVDLATYLKECTPEPSERKLRLPGLLEEMLEGKFIRPEAYLPLLGVTHRMHRVVNVLTDEGTVFSTKARAPTLVFFEIVASDLQEAALSDRFRPDENVASRQRRGTLRRSLGTVSPTATYSNPEDSDANAAVERLGTHLDILNYLDANIVETYVADLMPPSMGSMSSRDTIADDFQSLNVSLPPDCAPPRRSSLNGSVHSDAHKNGDEPCVDEQDDNTSNSDERTSKRSSSSSGDRCKFFGERFEEMRERVRAQSKFAHLDGWDVLPVIAKSFDDMRQEVFVLQGVRLFQLIFRKHNLDLWLHYYSIVCAGKDCGLLEVIVNAQSLDGLKKKAGKLHSSRCLPDIFDRACARDPVTGEHDPERLEVARHNFVSSMAAYSLLSYVFLVKDRHNGNIMLDTDGHVIHIDFGFVLGIAPGNSFSLETAPFKLTAEMVDVMGSAGFERYKLLVRQGLVALHLEAKQILSLVYLSSKDSCFPCFQGKSRARIIRRLERRLCLGWALQDVERTATHMVAKSYNHIGTRHYDKFQQLSNGILP